MSDAPVRPPRAARALLGLPATSRGRLLGWPIDILFDAGLERAVGVALRCVDGACRFLPWVACTRLAGHLEVSDSRLMLDDDVLAFYLSQGESLMRRVQVGGRVADIDLDARGHVLAVHLLPAAGDSRRPAR